MKSRIPQFTAQRMVMDYVNKFYLPANAKVQTLAEDNGGNATTLASWKDSIRQKWSGVRIRRLGDSVKTIKQGFEFCIRVGVSLNGLNSSDVHVECLLGQAYETKAVNYTSCHLLKPVADEKDETVYEIRFTPAYTGLVGYQLRAYPYHKLLCHHLETGFMKWV